MSIPALPGLGQDLGRRFTVTGALPVLAVVLTVLVELGAGAPAQPPSRQRLTQTLTSLTAGEWTLLVLVLIVGALLLQPLQRPTVRLMEGYSLLQGPARLIGIPLLALWQRRWDRLELRQRVTEPNAADLPAMANAAARLRRLPRERDRLLPTRLGNTLRAAEDRPGDDYGLDVVAAWPLLYPLLPERTAAMVDDARDQLDAACRLSGAFTLMGVISAALLPLGWWTLLVLTMIALAALAYRGAVHAAYAYGELVYAAVALHRFDLLTALHLPLPDAPEQERERFLALSRQLRQGWPGTKAYQHNPEHAGSVGSASQIS